MRWVLPLLLCLATLDAHAQSVPQFASPPPEPGFLTNFNFHLGIESLRIEDERFNWDADFGGDLDVVDYGFGRINLLANYETVLGIELRRFDPIQGNYTLDVLGSVRAGASELAVVFHHVSRHLSDRPKRRAIDWNTLGGQYWIRHEQAPWRVDGRARVLWVIQRSFVDYRAQADADLALRHAFHPAVALVARANLTLMFVVPELAGRGTQRGGRIEGGIRLAGTGAAVEFFAGYERRIDADAFEALPQRWALVGFRITGPG